MQTLSILLFFTIAMPSCGENRNYAEHASSDYYSNNEDKFGFLVFDTQKIDTFFKKYSPIEFQNPNLKRNFENLTADANFKGDIFQFKKHTKGPSPSDYSLALNVLKAINNDIGRKYFNAGLNYLFFSECLPNEFRNKWTQTQLGDFEFNVTFFNLLRTNCKVFDDHIYGNTGYWDENIKKVFVDDIYNEITPDKASQIKDCILSVKAFDEVKLKPDRDNFISFLDNVVERKWRLFLIAKTNLKEMNKTCFHLSLYRQNLSSID